jgi:glycosyltransferase involved in cell wall biosynthesis
VKGFDGAPGRGIQTCAPRAAKVMAGSSNVPPSITVFFPCFNDGESLRRMIPLAAETLGKITPDFEIVVVDDGSSDQTPSTLESLKSQFASLRVARHARNLGYGAALQTGFRSATKDWVFYTDGDGQYDVRELAKLWSLVADGVDGVVGFKTQRADSWPRRAIGKFYNAVVRFLFRLKFRDVDCDFRLLRRKVVESISLTAASGAVCVDLMNQVQRGGFRILETPVSHHPRQFGESHFFHVRPVVRTGLDLLRLWFRRK